MHIARKILIIAIVLLFSYIIYSLLQKRKVILSSVQQYYKQKELQIEGFCKDDPNYDAIMNDIKKISDKITNTLINNDQKPIVYINATSIGDTTLKDVFMKASYNSAFTGNYLSSEMVKFCLSQGCRFLDFEVDISEVPVVVCKNNADSGTPTNRTRNDAPASISLYDVLTDTLDAAFTENNGSKYRINNLNDPLFIHIRCTNATYENVYTNVLKKLANDHSYKSYLKMDHDETTFTNIVDPNTYKWSDCNRKAIIILCKTTSPSASASPSTSTSASSNYNYELSSAKNYTDINNIVKCSSADPNSFQIVLSDPTSAGGPNPLNPDVFKGVKYKGYNITCISYSNYLTETYLTKNERKYEDIFIGLNYSYIKMSDFANYESSN